VNSNSIAAIVNEANIVMTTIATFTGRYGISSSNDKGKKKHPIFAGYILKLTMSGK